MTAPTKAHRELEEPDTRPGLTQIHADLCDEMDYEEHGEYQPLLVALNNAYNLGASQRRVSEEGEAADPYDVIRCERGLEVCEQQQGWVVITGKEGEEFHPVALFFDRGRAEQYCELEYDDGAGEMEPVAFDSCAMEAVIVRDRIVCANDYTLDTFDKLRARIKDALAAADSTLPQPPERG